MKIHEYQAKELFRAHGVPVPDGIVCATADEAEAAAAKLGGRVVVKAQIHAGGRGKGGGVKLAGDPAEARAAAEAILGMQLVTHQTGPEGKEVLKVLVEAASGIARELYLSLVVDRAARRLAVIASAEGGMNIEAVAAERPEAILTRWVDPVAGYQPHLGRAVAAELGMKGRQPGAFAKLLGGLVALFHAADASLLEINPLIVTDEGALVALDGKITLDDNALYRHPDLSALRDPTEEDPREAQAAEHDLNYIKLDGQVGCMVNGAGLAMATMDIIKHYGSAPANFLDVGGTATAERVEAAFRILLDDPSVEAVLVNIFGGIVRCDVVAHGIVEAAGKVDLSVPLIVRLQGTNAEEGRQILADSGLPLRPATTLDEAARHAVAAVGGGAS
jgi:succinyl-CoA synthetase beta subunit